MLRRFVDGARLPKYQSPDWSHVQQGAGVSPIVRILDAPFSSSSISPVTLL